MHLVGPYYATISRYTVHRIWNTHISYILFCHLDAGFNAIQNSFSLMAPVFLYSCLVVFAVCSSPLQPAHHNVASQWGLTYLGQWSFVIEASHRAAVRRTGKKAPVSWPDVISRSVSSPGDEDGSTCAQGLAKINRTYTAGAYVRSEVVCPMEYSVHFMTSCLFGALLCCCGVYVKCDTSRVRKFGVTVFRSAVCWR